MRLWDNIDEVVSGRMVASLSVWMFLVPVVVKLVEVNGRIDVPIDFLIFYFSSLCFFVASILHILFCPRFIKNYKFYSQFYDEGLGVFNLELELADLKTTEASKLAIDMEKGLKEVTSNDISLGRTDCINIGRELSINFLVSELDVVFTMTRAHKLASKAACQAICFLLIISACFLLSIVMLKNFGLVWQYSVSLFGR